MPAALRLAVPALALAWLNAYICRDFFHFGFTGYTNSMQGFWAGLSRLASLGHWLAPRWWPWHDAGSPFEWTYAPVVPGLAALWSSLTGLDSLRGVQAASGIVYCLGPVTLYLFCAVASNRIVWSFATGLAYSLLAPTEWVVPDGPAALVSIANARRLYLMAAWDETPHYASLALLPVVLLFASKAMETGRRVYWLVTAGFVALSLMTSAFGATVSGIGMLCLLTAFGREHVFRNASGVLLSCLAGWAIASPSLPPSLIATIRANATVHGDSGWDLGGLTALAITAAGFVAVLVLCDRFRAGWFPRFVFLFAWVMTAIPALFQYLERHFIPQPGRYKVEAELGLTLAAAFAVYLLIRHFPRRLHVALALVGVFVAAEGVVKHRRYEKLLIREKNSSGVPERRVAEWAAANLPTARIALPGSLAIWFNRWSDGQQFSGSSYSTAYNPVQQIAWNAWLSASTPEQAADGLTWLKAFGTSALAVTGPQSGEFWKAMNHPELYLPCETLWQQADTTICHVPGARPSLAHVLSPALLVNQRPRGTADTAEVRRYASALDSAGPASFTWQGTDAAQIQANVKPGEAVSVQISWHRGWTAVANGRPAPIRSDGLGLTVVEPSCDGPCDIRLSYSGGAELITCHLMRWAVIAAAGWWIWRSRRCSLPRPSAGGMALPLNPI